MKKFQSFISSIKTLAIVMATVFLLTQCTEEEDFLTPSPRIEQEEYSEEINTEATITSISISGAYTEMVDSVDCASCTFTVAAGSTIVDGVERQVKPGTVICLEKGVVYSSVEFTNMEGTESDPIIIGYCSK